MAAARKSGAGRKAPACPVTAYAKAVTGGKITAGRLVKLACARHLEDLKTGKTRGLSWDRAAALHAIEFFTHLRHSTGEWAGQPFVLQPWQQFVVGSVFGWKRADGLRRFRTAYVEVARKNGKSALLAGIALYALIADGEAGAHVYAAATTLTDLGASFPVASTTNVLTLTLLAAPNSGEIGVRVVEEVSGAVVEVMLDSDIPAATQLLSPRNFMNNGATAAAVAYDCSGVYVETDY